jgi:uncharacterized protein
MSSLPNETPQGEQQDQLLTAPAFAPPANGPRDGFAPPEFQSPETAAALPPLPPQDGHLDAVPLAIETEEFPAADPTPGPALAPIETPSPEAPLFVASMLPEVQRPARIPHLGHLLLLLLLLAFASVATLVLMAVAVHFQLYGATSLQSAATEVHYTIGSEGLLYVFTLLGSLIVFPLIWHKGLFAGVQWNARTALRLSPWLVGTAFICFLLALLNTVVFPGPKNTPIEDVFRQPGAAWLLFVFGVTFAPFFEEMFFRGFLLPSLATACDWSTEIVLSRGNRAADAAATANPSAFSILLMVFLALITVGTPLEMFRALTLQQWKIFLLCVPVVPTVYAVLYSLRQPSANEYSRPLAEKGHPQWSIPALIIGSVATSIPFAGMHAAQTGYSLGPFLLLVTVSLVLCTVRLWARSLAASTLVHASYNFMLFASMLVASHGFRHMDKL